MLFFFKKYQGYLDLFLNKSIIQYAEVVDMKTSQRLEQLIYELFKKLYLENKNNRHMSQGKILKILYKKGDISQKEMQDMLHVKSGTISESINKLEKKGLLIRQSDEVDRRKKVLHLTEDGKINVETHSALYQKEIIQLFDVLSDDEKKEFEKILKKLLERNDDYGTRK